MGVGLAGYVSLYIGYTFLNNLGVSQRLCFESYHWLYWNPHILVDTEGPWILEGSDLSLAAYHTVDAKILHQLRLVVYPIIYKVS